MFQGISKLLVLGAGFSAPAGIPTMRQFFAKAWNFLSSDPKGLGGHRRDFSIFTEVERAWINWQPKNPDDRFDLEKFAIHVAKNVSELRNNLIYTIVRTFDLSKEPLLGSASAPLWTELYLALARQLLEHRKDIAVVSFNYDLLLDQALLRLQCAPNYHLPEGSIVPLNEQRKPNLSFHLLKPHGSINWLSCENQRCPKITVDWSPGPENENRPGNWQTGRGSDAREHHQHGLHLYPIIVPPERKYRGKRQGWPGSLIHEVQQAVPAVIEHAKKVLFIGWSATETDKHWRRVFAKLKRKDVIVANAEIEQQEALKARYKGINSGAAFHFGNDGDVRSFATSAWWSEFLSN